MHGGLTRMIVGFGVAAACWIGLTARSVHAQSERAGAIVAGIELPFLRYERLTLEAVDVTSQASLASQRSTVSRISLGLASDVHAQPAIAAMPLINAHGGYVFADRLHVALRVAAGFASVDLGDSGAIDLWSLGLGPRVEYVFPLETLRPFVGLESAFIVVGASSESFAVSEQDGHVLMVGPAAGFYFFLAEALSFDLRAAFTYGTGSTSQAGIDVQGSSVSVVQIETDTTRLEASIWTGLSAWL